MESKFHSFLFFVFCSTCEVISAQYPILFHHNEPVVYEPNHSFFLQNHNPLPPMQYGPPLLFANPPHPVPVVHPQPYPVIFSPHVPIVGPPPPLLVQNVAIPEPVVYSTPVEDKGNGSSQVVDKFGRKVASETKKSSVRIPQHTENIDELLIHTAHHPNPNLLHHDADPYPIIHERDHIVRSLPQDLCTVYPFQKNLAACVLRKTKYPELYSPDFRIVKSKQKDKKHDSEENASENPKEEVQQMAASSHTNNKNINFVNRIRSGENESEEEDDKILDVKVAKESENSKSLSLMIAEELKKASKTGKLKNVRNLSSMETELLNPEEYYDVEEDYDYYSDFYAEDDKN